MTWQIELHNGEDNRLTRTLVQDGLKPALDIIERDWRQGWRASQGKKASKEKVEGAPTGEGALIIVGKRGQDKFFSNGETMPRMWDLLQWMLRCFVRVLLI